MKSNPALLAVAASFLFVNAGFASITNIFAQPDADGAIASPSYSWSGIPYANFYGLQYRGPGRILFGVFTDTQQAVTLRLDNLVDNGTGFAWLGYQVNIFMNKPFSISTFPELKAPAGWSVASYTSGAVNTGTNWFGTINFSGSPAIADQGTIDFTYRLSFVGSVQFTQEMIPVTAVPEPASCSLLIVGGFIVRLITRRWKHQ